MCSIHTAPDLPRSSEVLIQQSRWPTDRATIAYDAAFRAVNGCKDLVQVKSSIPVVVPPFRGAGTFSFGAGIWLLSAAKSQLDLQHRSNWDLAAECSQIHPAAKSILQPNPHWLCSAPSVVQDAREFGQLLSSSTRTLPAL